MANRSLGNENVVGGYFARHHASIDITHANANHNEGMAILQSMPPCFGNGAEARFNQGNGFVIGQSGFWMAVFLMAYGNAGYGYHLDHCQAFMPMPVVEKRLGHMHKVHSHVSYQINFPTPCRVLPTVLLAFLPLIF